MTTLAMQKRIISKLKETKDKSLLQDIYNLLNLFDEADKILAQQNPKKTSLRLKNR